MKLNAMVPISKKTYAQAFIKHQCDPMKFMKRMLPQTSKTCVEYNGSSVYAR